MNNNLNNLTDDHIDQIETDDILRSYITRKFDTALKQDIKQELKQRYNFSKENKVAYLNGRKRRKFVYLVTAVAACFGFLMIAINFFSPSSNNRLAGDPPPFGENLLAGDPPPFGENRLPGDPPPFGENLLAANLASSYLVMADIHHSGALKGNTNSLDIRRQAILAFNTKKYAEARQYFSQIEEKTEEDIFYSAVSSLYDRKYDQAIADLTVLTETGTRYKIEAEWYLAIAYILSGNDASAKTIFSQMKPSSWNYEKSRAFLKALE